MTSDCARTPQDHKTSRSPARRLAPFIFINNRLEGNALFTIAAMADA
jgi:hypothetical protein